MNSDNGLPYKIIDIKRISSENEGALQFFESGKDIPFEIKRIYYITDVPKNVWRGRHAHKKLHQLLFCLYGEILLKLSDGTNDYEIILNKPNKGVIITYPLWRDMFWIKKDSVLCIAASEFYDETDYIRNYDEYIKYISDLRG